VKHGTWKRDAALVVGLIVLHEAMKRALSDGALVAALLSGGGAHSLPTIFAGVLMLTLRLALLVLIPGFVGAALATAAVSAVTRRLRKPTMSA
jgi:hypothetical protein